jgi:hypothetical protein
MNADDYWAIVAVLTIVIGALGVCLYAVWRMGSEPEPDNDEYGAPHG